MGAPARHEKLATNLAMLMLEQGTETCLLCIATRSTGGSYPGRGRVLFEEAKRYRKWEILMRVVRYSILCIDLQAFGEELLSGIAVPHYTMSAHDSQEPSFIHEKLKGQVTLSIKEALDKATGVLSNLHRVQSYLDVIKTMTSSRTVAHPEGIHSALDQVKSLRNDTAALLQTIYLAEIGLQSMQEFDKPGNQQISADTLSNGNGGIALNDHQHTVTPTEGGVMVVDVDMPGDIDFGAPSTAKKDTYVCVGGGGGGSMYAHMRVWVQVCVGCACVWGVWVCVCVLCM